MIQPFHCISPTHCACRIYIVKLNVSLLDTINAHPTFAAGFNNLGTVYYAEEKWQEAVDAYQAAIRLQANYLDAYYNLGLAFIKLKNHDAAMHAFEALLALAPHHVGAQFQTGRLLMLNQQPEKALNYFLRIVEAHPYHLETLMNIAACYLQLGSAEEANTYYMKTLALAPADKQVLFNLGVIHAQSGRLKAAVDYYLQAIHVDTDFYEAHHNLASLFLSMNNQEAALKHFQEALRLQPANEAIQHSINVLTKTEGVEVSPPAYIRSLFDSYADHYDEHLKKTLHYQVPLLFLRMLESVRTILPATLDILDLGCGTGLCGEVMKPLARSLIGVDLSEKMLAVAARKQIYDDLIAADMMAFLQKSERAFDLIMAGDTLVYVGDLAAIFTQLHRALRPKGKLLFNLEISEDQPYRVSASGRFGHAKDYVDQLALAHHFTVLRYEQVGLRRQNEKEVMGHLYLLEK